MITLGGIAIVMGLIRILAFKIPESPRYLLSKGRDVDAVEAVNYIARYNGKQETLTLDMLQAIDAQFAGAGASTTASTTPPSGRALSRTQLVKESLQDYQSSSFKRLFQGRKMAQHTSVTFLMWLTLGIGYPLYFAFITSYLQTKSTYSANSSLSHTYMIYCIVSAVGVLGPVAAGFCVETRLGRRWMMALSAVLTGVFLYLYTLAKTEAADIGFQCATGILGNFGMLRYLSHLILKLTNARRICHHVRFHAGILPRTSSWNRYRHRSHTATIRRSGRIIHLHIQWLYCRSHICQRSLMDCHWNSLFWSTIRNAWSRVHLRATRNSPRSIGSQHVLAFRGSADGVAAAVGTWT